MTDRYESRATTHADNCWSWGPAHYECAVREIERLRAEAVKLRNLRADAIHACALANIRAVELEEVLRLAASLVDELDGLVGESDGVSGLHLNGDVATWDELLPGGRFERLSSLDELRAALAQREEEGEKP